MTSDVSLKSTHLDGLNSNPDVYINHDDFSSSTQLDGLKSNLDVHINHDDSNLIHTSLDGTDISHDVSDSTKGDRYLHNTLHDELYEIENHDASEYTSEISNLRIHYDNTICAIGNHNEYSDHNGLWDCYMMIYDSVKSSGTYNYLCRRIPFPQPLNISATHPLDWNRFPLIKVASRICISCI